VTPYVDFARLRNVQVVLDAPEQPADLDADELEPIPDDLPSPPPAEEPEAPDGVEPPESRDDAEPDDDLLEQPPTVEQAGT
jgi:hypothetical protein